jgi:hypothetical protein
MLNEKSQKGIIHKSYKIFLWHYNCSIILLVIDNLLLSGIKSLLMSLTANLKVGRFYGKLLVASVKQSTWQGLQVRSGPYAFFSS